MACKYKYNNNWYNKEELVSKLEGENSNFQTLYKNLLKEFEINARAKAVLDRVKRDYVKREAYDDYKNPKPLTDAQKKLGVVGNLFTRVPEKYYTLEEQQEEAIVSLISEMIAGKIKETENTKNLLTLLKKLLQQINDFIRSLINQKEIYIDKIPESNKEQLIESKLKQMIKDEIIRKECV